MIGGGSPQLCLSPRHCLSQSDCVCSQGFYWKDLTRLGRDLAKTVALDHTLQGFPAQVGLQGGICVSQSPGAPWLCGIQPSPCPPQAANWIPVPRWSGDLQDEELLRLIPVLAQLGQAVRCGHGDREGTAALGSGHSHPRPCLSLCRRTCAPRSSGISSPAQLPTEG